MTLSDLNWTSICSSCSLLSCALRAPSPAQHRRQHRRPGPDLLVRHHGGVPALVAHVRWRGERQSPAGLPRLLCGDPAGLILSYWPVSPFSGLEARVSRFFAIIIADTAALSASDSLPMRPAVPM